MHSRSRAVAAGLVVLCACTQLPDVPPPSASVDGDIPLGPPRYALGLRTEEKLSPVDRSVRSLRADVFSFIRASPQVEALELLIQTENVSLLTANSDAGPAARLYHWCGLRATDPASAEDPGTRLLKSRDPVMVFDADLHHMRTVGWVARRAMETGFCESLAPEVAGDPWVKAERGIVRLRPSAFPEVPQAVRDDLERRGCRIPQTPGGDRWQNIVPGRFAAARASDWAALCSRSGVSTILVYPNGTARGVRQVHRADDRGYLQQDVNGIVFSRRISAATPAYIRVKNHPTLVPGLPRFDHDGINDAFVGKASTVWYRSAGRWLKLLGAD
jgi:hypothetical protein